MISPHQCDSSDCLIIQVQSAPKINESANHPMNWLKDLIFGNEAPAKQATSQIPPQPSQSSKENQQGLYLRETLNFVKQHRKQAIPQIKTQTSPQHSSTKEDPQALNLRKTLDFAKQQCKELHHKQDEHERWQENYGSLHVDELKKLSGTEFEVYLAKLFKSQGYLVEMTPLTGDYGADLILYKEQQRIAVQAKCYTGSVGVTAVQEALSGMAYYRCHSAWVVTTGNYTANAIELARQSNVRLLSRNELGQLIVQMQSPTPI